MALALPMSVMAAADDIDGMFLGADGTTPANSNASTGNVIKDTNSSLGSGAATNTIVPGQGTTATYTNNKVRVKSAFGTQTLNIVGGNNGATSNEVTNNEVTVDDTDDSASIVIQGAVVGGAGTNVNVTGNTVKVVSGKVEKGVTGGGANSTASANIAVTGNKVYLEAGATVSSNSDLYGGYLGNTGANSGTGKVKDNDIHVTNATIDGAVHGGGADGYGDVTANHVTVTNATVTSAIGGVVFARKTSVSSSANENTVTLTGSTSGEVYGGKVALKITGVEAHADKNEVTLTVSGSTTGVYGGAVLNQGSPSSAYSAAGSTASENTVDIDNYAITGDVYGGIIQNTGTTNKNEVTLGGASSVSGTVRGGFVANTGTADENTVTITSSGTIGGGVVGGAGVNVNAAKNTVTVTNATVTNSVTGAVSKNTTAGTITLSENKVYLNAGATVSGGDSYGAFLDNSSTGTAIVTQNEIHVTNATVTGGKSVVGGGAWGFGNVTQNKVVVSGSTIANEVVGGVVGGVTANQASHADENTVTLTNSNATNVFGGKIDVNVTGITAHADKNEVTLTGSGTVSNYVIGGAVQQTDYTYAAGTTASENKVDIGGSYTINSNIFGGRVEKDGNAKQNEVTLRGTASAQGDVYGGVVNGSGDATANKFFINDSASVAGTVYGGVLHGTGDAFTDNELTKNSAASSLNAVANFNTVNFGYSGAANITTLNTNLGTTSETQVTLNTAANTVAFGGKITGMGGIYKTGTGTLTISGSTNDYVGDTTVAQGTLELAANSTLSSASAAAVNSGATLTAREGSAIGGNLSAGSGATINLLGSGHNTILAVGGDASISNAIINVAFTDEPTPGISVLSVTGTTNIVATTVTGTYGTLDLNFSTSNGIQLLSGGYNDDRFNGILEKAEAHSEASLASMIAVNQAADLVTTQGFTALLSGAKNGGRSFGAIGYGDSRYETGSHVNAKGYNLLVGLGASVGNASVGGFFETGDGDYDTHNSFSTGKIKGTGDIRYHGVGLLGRFDIAGGAYVEASLRAGRTKNDYKNSALGTKSDTKSNYLGGHVGAGYVWQLNAKQSAEVYSQYLWTHQKGDTVRGAIDVDGVSTRATLKFSATDSQRLRIGGRYTWASNEQTSFFAGVAYEHEFDGDADARLTLHSVNYGDKTGKIKSPSLDGDVGIGEIGIKVKPSANSPVSIEAGVQAYGGDRKGATGHFNLKYAF
ncbi:MAG: autotransporter-associated beta strand repeat-containing protein [Candidatus Accumulibacter sp.]|jgi:hypothetical protein|nr:autotransporter-associated beta strand repeat-containing protein [Accumulibacter sp.]